MKILLSNPRGFCAGVNMAIDVVDQVLDVFEGETVYVYHEIVHNKHVVERFKNQGVIFVEDVDEVPEGGIVVFSAHGIPPTVRSRAAERHLHAIDATCPLVTKVHSEAIRYARQGYQILLVGHRDHQEVVGTRGEAPDATQVVESPADIPNLTIHDPDKLVYLTQTTLSMDDASIVIGALKEAFPTIKSPPSEDICYATTNRQHAVRALAPECDIVLVVGSRNSSNSNRLVEIAEAEGVKGYLIDDAGEIDWEWFEEGTRHSVLGTAEGTGHQALGTGSDSAAAPNAQCPMPNASDPNAQCPMPNASDPNASHPNAQCPMPNASDPNASHPNAQCPMPNASDPNASDPNAECRMPSADLTVLVTAGASAPEDLVAGVCKTLIDRFGGDIEQRDVFDEDVYFALPGQLRRDMRKRGIDPEERKIHVALPEITADAYGVVGVTVSAKPSGD